MKLTPLMTDLERLHGKPVQQILVEALNAHGNVKNAAAALSLPAPTLTNWLARLGISQATEWKVMA